MSETSALAKRKVRSQESVLENTFLELDATTCDATKSKKIHVDPEHLKSSVEAEEKMDEENRVNGSRPQRRNASKTSYSPDTDAEEEEGTVQSGVNKENQDVEDDGSNDPIEAGQIMSVYVENFMCHRKLSVKFCKNLNFVNGSNGSGEYARSSNQFLFVCC